MNFKQLLHALANTFDHHEFTSNDAYYRVGYGKVSSLKIMSNRLAKLYFMGFLKRKRVKRSVIMDDGREYNKGYCYLYSISSQGFKYLNYIATRSDKRKDDELMIKTVIDEDSNIMFAKIIKNFLNDYLFISIIKGSLTTFDKMFLRNMYIYRIINENKLDINEKLQLSIILYHFLQ